MKLILAVCVVILSSPLGIEAQEAPSSDSQQQSELGKTTTAARTINVELAPLPLPSAPAIQLPTLQPAEALQDLNEEQLSKLLFDRRSTLPDGPNPKVSEKENSMCPSGVGNSCALLGGWVYFPDKIGSIYHDKTWWEAMKNPAMIAVSLTLTGATILDIEGSQACIDKRTCRVALFLLLGLILSVSTSAGPKKNKSSASKSAQRIIVFARKTDQGIEYRLNKQTYTAKDLDYMLGELHIYASRDSAIVVVLEDNMLLSDVKEVPAMALKAGYTDVRAYVYWKRTGRMAGILFGPVLKATADPRKL